MLFGIVFRARLFRVAFRVIFCVISRVILRSVIFILRLSRYDLAILSMYSSHPTSTYQPEPETSPLAPSYLPPQPPTSP